MKKPLEPILDGHITKCPYCGCSIAPNVSDKAARRGSAKRISDQGLRYVQHLADCVKYKQGAD